MNNYFNVIKNVSFLCFSLYGICYTTRDIFSNLTLSLCLISFIVAVLYCIRIPAPPKALIEDILGKDLDETFENDSGVLMRSIGHRGASLDAPENSLEGFKLCLEHGMRFIEFDVALTKDEVPVVFHDANLERIADLTHKIKDLDYEALTDIDIGEKHAYGHKYKNIQIPTLEATVNQLLNDGQIMFIDLKCYKYKVVDVIIKLFQDLPELHSRAVVTTFSPVSIYQIRKRDPKIVCGLAWRPFAHQEVRFLMNSIYPVKCVKQILPKLFENAYGWALGSFIYYLIGISVILIRKDAISEVMINAWKQRNVRVIAWTVNSPTEKQYFARVLRIPYMTDTVTAENSTHSVQNNS